MQTLTLTLSIISSVVFIIYLLVAMFSSKQENNTITIRGSFVTRNIDTAGNSYTINHVVEHH